MKTLKNWLQESRSIPTWLPLFFFIVALFGFADAAFLSIEHYRGTIVPCAIVTGCEKVTTSHYSLLLGIPVAYLGALYYGSILFFCVLYFDKKNSLWIKIAAALTPFGLLFSLWFLFVQAFILQAYCLYCLGSIVTSTLLFIGAVRWIGSKK